MHVINAHTYAIFVLAPMVETSDDNLNYYYDFSQSKQEYTEVFKELQLQWFWIDVALKNYKTTIDAAIIQANNLNKIPIFLNLCDGDEQNDSPGLSIINYLVHKNCLFTGSSAYFYEITTSKALMKKAFEAYNIKTPKWWHIKSVDDIEALKNETIKFPLILKPSVSGGSIGVGIKNVVYNLQECINQLQQMLQTDYNGWNLNIDGIIAEEFIIGEEFTIFLIGNYNQPALASMFTPVQRIFHASLPEKEKFLSFERLWEIYENESAMPNNENFYEYGIPNLSLIQPLQQLSWDAFAACKGTGYTRADIRRDNKTGELFVLEVNAQCGLSKDENYTSIGAILKASNASFTHSIEKILALALPI